MQLSAEHNYL